MEWLLTLEWVTVDARCNKITVRIEQRFGVGGACGGSGGERGQEEDDGLRCEREQVPKEKRSYPTSNPNTIFVISSAMLPRRAFQLLLQRVALPVPQATAFATASAVRLGKTLSSSSGLALEAAVKKVQESATAKFDETVDVAVNLNIDGSKSDQNVRGQVNHDSLYASTRASSSSTA